MKKTNGFFSIFCRWTRCHPKENVHQVGQQTPEKGKHLIEECLPLPPPPRFTLAALHHSIEKRNIQLAVGSNSPKTRLCLCVFSLSLFSFFLSRRLSMEDASAFTSRSTKRSTMDVLFFFFFHYFTCFCPPPVGSLPASIRFFHQLLLSHSSSPSSPPMGIVKNNKILRVRVLNRFFFLCECWFCTWRRPSLRIYLITRNFLVDV